MEDVVARTIRCKRLVESNGRVGEKMKNAVASSSFEAK